jgi:hypothetical protein
VPYCGLFGLNIIYLTKGSGRFKIIIEEKECLDYQLAVGHAEHHIALLSWDS